MPTRFAFLKWTFWALATSAFAQGVSPPPAGEPFPFTSPAPASVAAAAPAPAASAPALMPLEPVSAPSTQNSAAPSGETKVSAEPPPPEGCRPLTERAMASDLKAATAQSNRRDLAEQVAFLEEAIDWWTRAALQCDGRAKERAQRNIADNQKAREKLAEQLQSGPQCEASHKGATTLQDLARQTLSERRFMEAAALFRKSEDAWDNASELCTGTQHVLSIQRRDQSAIDGHNAEFCAPVFERAREQTLKLRGLTPTVAREERQEASQQAETAWREAMVLCKGGVIEAARNQAQAIARERGTPWIVKPMPTLNVAAVAPPPAPAVGAQPKPTVSVSGAASANPVSATPPPMPARGSATPMAPVAPPIAATAATAATAAQSTPAVVAATIGTVTTTTAAVPAGAGSLLASIGKALNKSAVPAPRTDARAEPATSPQAESNVMPSEFSAGTARFVGKFTRDADSPTYSGTGRIAWGNGDVFEGTFVKGKRHGTGLFIWANGQRHEGEWVDDIPTGQAKVIFPNGNRYDGIVQAGLPQGRGRMEYASGDVYDGEFDNGRPQGKGLYTWKNGQTFEGEWKAERPNGQGKLRFANGNVFTGTVVNGVPNGSGQMVFVTGDTYTGTLVQGEPEGRGSMLWANGDQYVGEWKGGKKHGAGVFTWKTGEKWEGNHENDVRQ